MIEPLQAVVSEVSRMPEDRQHEAARLLKMFIDGRISLEPHPLDREKNAYPEDDD